MKAVGFLFITVGIALLLLFFYNVMKERNKFVSPIPSEEGVKVIIVTPTR